MLPTSHTFESFYRHYATELERGVAALFIGAGLSIPGGYSSWKTLLRPIAEDLGLDIDQETDLVSLAQYKVNKDRSKSSVCRLLIEEFTKSADPTENHRLIASLPVHTLWTTNYDPLVEESYRAAHKRLDVKIKTGDLTFTLPGRDAVLYKMHGDRNDPQETVLTKEDYETFNIKRPLFTEMLKGDLISRTFLFLGFSFTDPNIDYILSRIRPLLGQHLRDHYCLMRRPEKPRGRGAAQAQYEYECRKLELRTEDLKRYGIQTLLIDEFAQVTEVLTELNKRAHAKDVFVSGSAYDFDPLGRDRVEALARLLGQEIIHRGYNLTSGFGLGIGGVVIVGAMEQVYREPDAKASDRMTLRPFPQTPPKGMTLAQLWTRYRKEMLESVGYTVFLCGNKWDAAAKAVVPANGMREEYEIAKSLGKYPIPIGATGGMAKDIWDEVVKDQKAFFKSAHVNRELRVLGDATKSNDEYIEAIFAIIQKTSRS